MTGAAFVIAATVPLAASAATTPAQQCQAAKNTSAGKYAACRQKAEAALVTKGDVAKYGAALVKCATAFGAAWQKAEAKAAKKGAACPDGPGSPGASAALVAAATVAAFQAVIDAHTTNIATALAGGELQDPAGDLATCDAERATCAADLATARDDLGTCQSDLAACRASATAAVLATGQTQCWDEAEEEIACAGTGQDGEFRKGLARSYTDNGDGTITDNRTGLMWEKLSDDGSIHDTDNVYTWAEAFAKIATLNTPPCFADHCDWRLPNINELLTIATFVASYPVTDPVFDSACAPGCSVMSCSCLPTRFAWSSTSEPDSPHRAFSADLWVNSGVETVSKSFGQENVRAVRGGL